MKLINYKYGYNNIFNCSIHGKIIVTQEEWQQIIKYVLNPAVIREKYMRRILVGDLLRQVPDKLGARYNIRVTATEAVVKKFKIAGYKRGNYMFLVLGQKEKPAGDIKLYYHKTDGGAEYLFDTFIKCANGHKEGVINDKTKYRVRLDGEPVLTIA